MKKLHMQQLFGVLCLMLFGLLARGQTPIPITGPTPVCNGSSGTYSINTSPGINYTWSSGPHGNISGPNYNPSALFAWNGAGTDSVVVKGYNSANVLVEKGKLIITILATPQPIITSNSIVGCQQLADSNKKDKEHPNATGIGDPHILDDGHGCIKVCENSTIIYTATGGAGSTYAWSAPGSTAIYPSGNTCTVVWGPAGPGSLTVTETTHPGNCVGSKTICIDIIHKPTAHFYTLPDSLSTSIKVCLKDKVIFIDNSTGTSGSPIMSWFWNFGDGETFTASNSTPVEHQFNKDGTFTVCVTVTNACGCKDTYCMKVDVMKESGVQIYCPSVVCENASATYSLLPAVPCDKYLWDAIGGTILGSPNDPTVQIQWDHTDTTGFGYVVFDASNCEQVCPGTTVIKIPVIQQHGHISGPTVVCPNSQFLYSMPEWPTTAFNWTVVSSLGATLWNTDQNNQIVLNTKGAETITLICNYTNSLLGCGGSAQITIQVSDPEFIVGPTKVCLNTNRVYSLGNGNTGTWVLTYPNMTQASFSGNAINPLFNQVGNYTLSVSGSFCSPAPFQIKVNPLPPAPDSLIGPAKTCWGSPTLYKAGAPLAGTFFQWSAATGTVNPGSNSPQTYATFSGSSPATISVVRVTTDEAHCLSAPLSKLVYLATPTVAITGPDTVCPSSVYTYNANYADGEFYEWTIGNTSMGSVQGSAGTPVVSVMWNGISGATTVKLRVVKCGISYNYTYNVYIRPLPTLNITVPTFVCRDAPATVSVNNPGIVAGGTVIEWNWGNGALTYGQTSTYAYPTLLTTPFSYNVSVKVTNPYGCTGVVTANKPIELRPAPVAQISPAGPILVCNGGTPNQVLTATLQSGFEPTSSLSWGNSSGLIPGYIGCTACSTYVATTFNSFYVIANGTNGCTDTSNIVQVVPVTCTPAQPCNIFPAPTLGITGGNSCGTVTLTGSHSSGAFHTEWGYPAQAQVITNNSTTLQVKMPTAGAYLFSYTVWFTNGTDTCILITNKTVTVGLVASMGHTMKCSSAGNSYDVTLFDHSTYFPGSQPTGFTFWVNGIPHNTGTTSNYVAAGLSPGTTYNVYEVVHFGASDSCYAYDAFTTPALPVAGFTASMSTVCINQMSVQFTNTSTPLAGLTNLWTFPTGIPNTATNPFRTFNTSGLNLVTLQVTDLYGCKSSAAANITVITPTLTGNLSSSGNNLCSGQPVNLTFNTSGTPPISTYYWMNDADTMFYNSSATTSVYNPGSYWALGTTAIGCRLPSNKVVVNFIKVPPAIITGDTTACLNTPYTLYGYAGQGLNYKWFKNNVLVGTGESYTDPATTVGIFTYRLVVSQTVGSTTCTDTSTLFRVNVHSLPASPYVSFNILDCTDYKVELTAYGGPAGASYNWSNGSFGNPTSAQGGGPYRVWLTDTYGCVSHGDVYVPKDPRSYLWVFPKGCYNFCSRELPKTILGPIYPFNYWAYLAAGSVDLDGYNTPVSNYDIYKPGIYNLLLDNGYCTAVSEDMDVSIQDCADCDGLEVDIKDIRTESCGPGCCKYLIDMNLNNGFGQDISFNLYSSSGSFSPGAGFIPAGGSYGGTFEFMPNAGFYGGPILITITYTDKEGKKHICYRQIELRDCPVKYRAAGTTGAAKVQSADGAGLSVVPNPAGNSTRIDYTLHSNVAGGSIEVYDITGRLVNRHVVDANKGNWQLPLENYKSGMYIIVLREQGSVILQTKLSVVH